MITSVQEALNRGFNLLAATIVALSGFAFLPEAFLEDDIADKVDDTLLFLLGLYAIAWYVRGRNRFVRSIQPVVFVVLALAIKMMGIAIEFADPESVGDDFGGLILFVLAVAVVIYQYKKTARLATT